MIYHQPFPYKNFGLWLLLLCCGLITAYVIFIALISIWVGLVHLHQVGFFIPILAGVIFMLTISLLFLSILKFLLTQMKEKDIIDL